MSYRIGDDSIRLGCSALEGGQGWIVRAAGCQCMTDAAKEVEQGPPIRGALHRVAGSAGTYQAVKISWNKPGDIALNSGAIGQVLRGRRNILVDVGPRHLN